MTRSAITEDIDGPIDAYSWIWEENSLQAPQELSQQYYVVAIEANANLVLTHTKSEGILLFAPDHDFDGVTPAPNCPEYSLYTIDAAPDLASWIETLAATWAD